MKKRLSLVLVICMVFSMAFTAKAAEEKSENGIVTEFMTYEKIQSLFPDIPLREDGYVEGYGEILSNEFANEEFNLSEPIERYSAEYDGGKCELLIYENGMYGVVGVEKIEEDHSTMRNPGIGNYSGKYRTYYSFSMTGFFYTYNVDASGGYSIIKDLSNPTSEMTGADPYWTFQSGATAYVRAQQNGYLPASVYGDGSFSYHNGGSAGFRLFTEVTNGNISAYIQAL